MSTLPPHAMATPINDEVDTSTMEGSRPSLDVCVKTQERIQSDCVRKRIEKPSREVEAEKRRSSSGRSQIYLTFQLTKHS